MRPNDIKEAVITFCKELLTNRQPSEGYEIDLIIKRKVHESRMLEKVDIEVEEISLEMFNQCLQDLWKKKGNKNDFLMRSGNDMKSALLSICNSVWKREEIPRNWQKTTLIQIFKGKGSFQDLKNWRNLHIKEMTQKVFANLVMKEAQELLYKNMSIFQIGTKKGHRATEHIYVLKTLMKKYEYMNKPIIVNFWDYSVFFDSESLIDVLQEAHKCQLEGKIYRLLYKLNEESIIQVSTPVGVTGETTRADGVGQGTVDGAVLNAVSVDQGIDEQFCDSV